MRNGGHVRLADWSRHYTQIRGVTPRGHKAWSDEEVQHLEEHYPDRRRLRTLLPWRTEKAIELKAARLGLTRTGKVWLDGQWDYAKPLYRRGEDVRAMIAPAVLKAPRQVWAKASKAGVRRPRKPPKPTSWPLLNQVRERAHILKLSMADLDALAETGSYFSAPRRLNLRAISRALKVLGGRFDVEWRDVQDGSLDT